MTDKGGIRTLLFEPLNRPHRSVFVISQLCYLLISGEDSVAPQNLEQDNQYLKLNIDACLCGMTTDGIGMISEEDEICSNSKY